MANIQFSVEDLKTPDRLEIVLRQFQAAISSIPIVNVPSVSDLVKQILPTIISKLPGPVSGYSGTVPLAKLTGGGANGSLTITNGVIVSIVAPT